MDRMSEISAMLTIILQKGSKTLSEIQFPEEKKTRESP